MGEEYTIPTTGRLLRVADVAYAMNVPNHTVRKWLMEGRISYIKLGRSTRISEHELVRLTAKGFRLSRE